MKWSVLREFSFAPFVIVPRGSVFIGNQGLKLVYKCPEPEAVVTRVQEPLDPVSVPMERYDRFAIIPIDVVFDSSFEVVGELKADPRDSWSPVHYLLYSKGDEK